MQSYTVAFRDVKVPVSGSYTSLVSPDPRPQPSPKPGVANSYTGRAECKLPSLIVRSDAFVSA